MTSLARNSTRTTNKDKTIQTIVSRQKKLRKALLEELDAVELEITKRELKKYQVKKK